MKTFTIQVWRSSLYTHDYRHCADFPKFHEHVATLKVEADNTDDALVQAARITLAPDWDRHPAVIAPQPLPHPARAGDFYIVNGTSFLFSGSHFIRSHP